MSIKDGRATIGVQQPSSDPYIEPVDAPDLSGLTQEVLAVVGRAKANWEDEPKYPAHERPAPPPPPRPGVGVAVDREQRRRQALTGEQSNKSPRRSGCSEGRAAPE